MHLATLLSARALTRIRAAAGREHQVVVVDDWSDLARVVRRLPIALAVVDPRPGGRVAAGELRELRHACPSLPVHLHVAPSAPAMQDLVELARDGFHRVVIEGYEDDPGHVREHLAALVHGAAGLVELLVVLVWRTREHVRGMACADGCDDLTH